MSEKSSLNFLSQDEVYLVKSSESISTAATPTWKLPSSIWGRLEGFQSFSVQFRKSVVPNSLRPHGQQHARLPCPSPTPGVYSNSCPLSQWYQTNISSSVVPFSSRLQSSPASGSFPKSQFFASGSQSSEASELQHQSFQWVFRTDFL